METTAVIWKNGEFIPWDSAQTHVLTHTLHYGGGAFEGIRFYNTDQGPAIFRLPEHTNRLFYSAQVLNLTMPVDETKIMDVTKDLVRQSKLTSGYIRPLVYYGYHKLGVNPIGNPVDIIIACWPWGAYIPHPCADVKISKYQRIHPASTVIDAKLTGHYVNGILASLELQNTHYHEALLLDSKGFISEGVGENFFLVQQGVIYTPRLGTILPGITRATIMEIARHLGYEVIEKDLAVSELATAEEAFFTGTAAEVTPIRSIDDHVFGNGDAGPITTVLKNRYMETVTGKNKEMESYLSYI